MTRNSILGFARRILACEWNPKHRHLHRRYHHSFYICMTVSLFLLIFHGTVLLYCVHRLDLVAKQQQKQQQPFLHDHVSGGDPYNRLLRMREAIQQRDRNQQQSQNATTIISDSKEENATTQREAEKNPPFDNDNYNNNAHRPLLRGNPFQNIKNPLRMIRNRNPNHSDNREFLLSRCDHNRYRSLPLLIHLHIGKAGGTSFHKTVVQIARVKGYCVPGSPNTHFDWSWIERQQQKLLVLDNDPAAAAAQAQHPPTTKMDVVMMLRDPVARAVSHFYYLKKQAWTAEIPRFRNQTIQEFLHDPETMIRLRDVWQDGQAGISWLTGTHIASFVSPHLTESQIQQKDLAMVLHPLEMMSLAADRLERDVKFFGILEDIPRSMQLLQHEFSLKQLPVMEHRNKNRKRPPNDASSELNPWVMETLQSLMPQDVWLYQYAKQLFEARWNHAVASSKNHTNSTVPARPPFPTVLPCTSLRQQIQCVAGPLAGLNYTFLSQ
jgi:hypothetical protein